MVHEEDPKAGGSYGAVVRAAMRGSNPTGGTVSIRDLSEHVGRHYEHIRKIVGGDPVPSRDLNDKIAAYLGLDPLRLWGLAQREKLLRKFHPDVIEDVEGYKTLTDLWMKMDNAQRAATLGFVKRLLASPTEKS